MMEKTVLWRLDIHLNVNSAPALGISYPMLPPSDWLTLAAVSLTVILLSILGVYLLFQKAELR